MMTTVGLFSLPDATAAQVARFAAAYQQIAFPWQRLIPKLRTDPDQRVIVRWVDTAQNTTGLYVGSTVEIHLAAREHDMEPFVIAHEIGHLVDACTFDGATRTALTDLYHASDVTYRHDGRGLDWSHDHEHTQTWSGRASDAYYLRLKESYADSFVKAFAPSLWPWTPDYDRFTHATDDLDAIRDLTLARSITVFSDVPDDHTHRAGIEWAAGQGIVSGYPDGTFRPDQPVTRAQLATMLSRMPGQGDR